MSLKTKEIWFIVGSQFLYGPKVLETVAARGQEMAQFIDAQKQIPCRFIYKGTVKTADEIEQLAKEANYSDACCGIVTWMHTFSPSKMWINGLNLLQKPYCHFATQYNREIPDQEIDMDFMNLNQAAHGDREHGFIATRMRLPRKVVAGFWQDKKVLDELGAWMRSAVGYHESKHLRLVRFGDNMREVAVTEGDKVEAQIKLGWQVNTWPVGELVDEMNAVTEAEIDALVAEYKAAYDLATDQIDSVRYQAREEIAMEKIFKRVGAMAFSNTFQDLVGMRQLPGLASQHLMAKGYGYGGEGDWKVSAMTRIVKAMTEGMEGGTAFMEDYTYHLAEDGAYSLGAHMLEVCPTIAATKPRIEVHALGIGDREAPARLVFEGAAGPAVVASLVDMGGRMRLIVQDVEAIKPIMAMPNLPVARVMWRAMPDLNTGLKLWLLAGGAHHTVMSYAANAQMLAGLGGDDADRVRAHHQGFHGRSVQAGAVSCRLAWKMKS
ncbi:MAG: L-arabinose isomerase [Eubacteriales bacterium]